MERYEHQIEKYIGKGSQWITIRDSYKGISYRITTLNESMFIKFSNEKCKFLKITVNDKNEYRAIDKKEIENIVIKTINIVEKYELEEFSTDVKSMNLILRFFFKKIGINLPDIYIPFHNSEQYKKSKENLMETLKKHNLEWLNYEV